MSDVRERTRLDGEESVGGMVRAKETMVSDWDQETVGSRTWCRRVRTREMAMRVFQEASIPCKKRGGVGEFGERRGGGWRG